jgi:hypothetical protein
MGMIGLAEGQIFSCEGLLVLAREDTFLALNCLGIKLWLDGCLEVESSKVVIMLGESLHNFGGDQFG